MITIELLKRDFNELQVRTEDGIYSMGDVLDGRGFNVIDDCTGDTPRLLLYNYLDTSVHSELGSNLEECIRNIEGTELLQEHSLNDSAEPCEIIRTYTLRLEGLGERYFNRTIASGTLSELTDSLKYYFKDTMLTDESTDIIDAIDLLEECEYDARVYAGVLKYTLAWHLVVGTFNLYDDATGELVEPKGLEW